MSIPYKHPLRGEIPVVEPNGLRFERSNMVLEPESGCYDFASLGDCSDDRAHYDAHYLEAAGKKGLRLSEELLRRLLDANSAFSALYESAGAVEGKRILLIGNGNSLPELLYLLDGASVVYTDLSIRAVQSVKEKFEASEYAGKYRDRIEFQAIDALHLPYQHESFDVIYGCAFVHHLRDLEPFFSEVFRCLKPGGRCVFLDAPYTGWWQFAKATFFKPFQLLSHWKTGISPEDKYATKKGGYTQEELESLGSSMNFGPLHYRRVMFLEHLFRRGSMKLFNERMSGPFARIGMSLDRLLLKKGFIRRHGLLLVWGFEK